MNLAAAFDATVDADPARVAIHAENRSLTRRGLRDAVLRAVRHLQAWQVQPGDRVGYLGLNRSEELVLLFALARIGAVFVPLNTRLAVTELLAIVAHARMRALVVDDAHHVIGAGIREAVDGLVLHPLDALAAAHPVIDDEPPMRIDDTTPVLLVYTSGTTGAPKGVVHTHGSLLANARAAVRAHAMTDDDRVLTALPLFHVGGLCIQTLPALLSGASLVLLPRFEAAAWLEAIASMRPTLALMVPATLRAALAHPDWPSANLSCLRVVMTGSSIIPRKLIDAIHARGVPVGQIYGSTETGPVSVALTAADALRKVGHAGWPCFPGSVRLVDERGHDVASGDVGEIAVRAPNVMQGYWREAPTHGFRDGWFATGDLGRFDGEGCLEVVGRNRDLIITGGENVYPAEVEDVLLSVIGIADAAVIGVPDERWGEVPVAFVVKTVDVDGLRLADERIALQLDDRLGRYKHPKRIVYLAQLPRNAMGKVQVQALRDALAT